MLGNHRNIRSGFLDVVPVKFRHFNVVTVWTINTLDFRRRIASDVEIGERGRI